MEKVTLLKTHVDSTTRVVFTAGKSYEVSKATADEMLEEEAIEKAVVVSSRKTRKSEKVNFKDNKIGRK